MVSPACQARHPLPGARNHLLYPVELRGGGRNGRILTPTTGGAKIRAKPGTQPSAYTGMHARRSWGSIGRDGHTRRPPLADVYYLKPILRNGTGHRVGLQNLPAGGHPYRIPNTCASGQGGNTYVLVMSDSDD